MRLNPQAFLIAVRAAALPEDTPALLRHAEALCRHSTMLRVAARDLRRLAEDARARSVRARLIHRGKRLFPGLEPSEVVVALERDPKLADAIRLGGKTASTQPVLIATSGMLENPQVEGVCAIVCPPALRIQTMPRAPSDNRPLRMTAVAHSRKLAQSERLDMSPSRSATGVETRTDHARLNQDVSVRVMILHDRELSCS